jgi:hypothetical protein
VEEGRGRGRERRSRGEIVKEGGEKLKSFCRERILTEVEFVFERKGRRGGRRGRKRRKKETKKETEAFSTNGVVGEIESTEAKWRKKMI